MKALSLNLVRNYSLLFLFPFLLCAGETQAQAPAENVQVRYAGMQNEHLVFYATAENEQRERCSFIIRDGNENILFEQRFNQAKFTKKILLPAEDLKKIRFEVTGKGITYQRQFVITTRIVEEISVEESK